MATEDGGVLFALEVTASNMATTKITIVTMTMLAAKFCSIKALVQCAEPILLEGSRYL
jgi:hypothetical protein